MINRYPLWKYVLMIALLVLGILYAIPNLYGDSPAVQISTKSGASIDPDVLYQVEQVLDAEHLSYMNPNVERGSILIRFANTDVQLKARDIIKSTLGDNYSVALNLAPKTPRWLQSLGAQPMKLGLDLQGGVNFLLNVDVDSVIKIRQDGDMNSMGLELRQNDIRYAGMAKQKQGIIISFKDSESRDNASSLLSRSYTDYNFTKSNANNEYQLIALFTPAAVNNIIDYAVEQNINVLSNRVNELGVSEAVVQRQGRNQISVDLPGVQDTARAKDLLGKTATLKFQLVDTNADIQSALAGSVPLGDQLYETDSGPILLHNQVILHGSSITYATAMMGQDGRPAVEVRLGGGGESLFARATAENIGKPLAVVYVETTSKTIKVNGKPVIIHEQNERVINVANIETALSNVFQITGLTNMRYAENLALLLRSGALTAPVDIAQERTIGPSLGAANIHKGIVSLVVGSVLVILFMAFYYSLFGVIADIALLLNIVFIVAILSLLGATLTMPGIAGIVLTVGMAVDANVLIYERVREELRNGVSPQASIQAGYERALATIIDANVTTLIVALILFALGSGSVKSFAVTLTIGILTSMVTAIFFTRGIVNLIYGKRSVKWLAIGIKPRLPTNDTSPLLNK